MTLEKIKNALKSEDYKFLQENKNLVKILSS